MINARSETASTKPAFREALKSRRCLIPADGFYEWVRSGKAKQPYCFEVGEGDLSAFAGIWDRWKDASGNWIKTCSILTTNPNAVTSAVHNRMPVILDPDSYDLWLGSGDDGYGCGIRSPETLRCSADAVLSHRHADQSCRERR
jgi:putative SOS response-associated peptidase YedK